ncbi:MAG TPA: hypothetical protein VG165_11160 [Solirubrobacteraceae bacterium]|nr:hypothetical protein [Solirubrobacteraceae bacterium]
MVVGRLRLGILAAVPSCLIAYETVRFADARRRIRHELTTSAEPD